MSDLSDCARHEHYITLSNSLPPPALNESEYRDRRLVTAVETFNALRPGDAYEARLAVQIVLCGAHADECLRLAGVHREDFAKMTRCRAQAASMMRAECSAKRTLEREQGMRLAVEAMAARALRQAAVTGSAPGQPEPTSAPAQPEPTSASPQQAEPHAPPAVHVAAAAAPSASGPWAGELMAAAPSPAPEPPAVHVAAAAAPSASGLRAGELMAAAPLPAPEPPAVAPPHVAPPRLAAANPMPLPVPAGSAPPPSPEAIAKAEAFAQREIVAAAQIRNDRGVTPQSKAYFRHITLPSDPAIIDALVRGSSDALTMLDEVGGEMLEAAD